MASRNAREALARRNRLIRAGREAGLSLRTLAVAAGLTAEGIRHICQTGESASEPT
jgi:hypothetical protein